MDIYVFQNAEDVAECYINEKYVTATSQRQDSFNVI